jgi:hypothetical protein
MKLKLSFVNYVDQFLKVYLNGQPIKNRMNDKIAIVLFPMFCQPRPGEFLKDDDTGIDIILTDQMVNDGRIYLSSDCRAIFTKYMIRFVKNEMFHHSVLNISHGMQLKDSIIIFMEQYGITEMCEHEMFRKYFYRTKEKIEKTLGESVTKRGKSGHTLIDAFKIYKEITI